MLNLHICEVVHTTYHCESCGEVETKCRICGVVRHICADKRPRRSLPRGFVVVEEFPDYMIDKTGQVRHIETKKLCWLARLSKTGEALITLRKDDASFVRSVQKLRAIAFPEEKTDVQ